MLDLALVLATALFFAAAIACVAGCDRITRS